MPSAQASTPLTRPDVDNLLHNLRNANLRYSQLAASIRQSLRPTHHARKRAAALNLKVSIESALELDYRHISEVPLAVLESASLPTSTQAPLPMPSRRPAVVKAVAPTQIVAPIPVRPAAQRAQIVLEPPVEISTKVVGREREIKRSSRPAPRCAMPQKPEAPDMLAFKVSVTIEALDSGAQDKSHWSSSESEESGSEEERSAWYSSDGEDANIKGSSGVVAFPVTKSSKAVGNCPRLDVSVDINSRLSWNSNMFSGQSSSSSTSSTTGPITPVSCLYVTSFRNSFSDSILFDM